MAASAGVEETPLRVLELKPQDGYLIVRWTGGTPPYRVQGSVNAGGDWIDFPGISMGNFSVLRPLADQMLVRVRTEQDTNAPTVPLRLEIKAAICDRALLMWEPSDDGDAGTGVSRYRLFRDNQPVLEVHPPLRHALITEIPPATTCAYSISAIDHLGNESAQSTPVMFTTPQCPASSTNEVEASPAITLAWDPNEEANVVGYLVYWGPEPGVYTSQIDAMQTTSITITEVEPGVPCFMTITAYNDLGGESGPAQEVVVIPSIPASLRAAMIR